MLRVLVGLGVLSLAIIGHKTPWAFLGLVSLLTGVVGFCPANALLGIRTCMLSKLGTGGTLGAHSPGLSQRGSGHFAYISSDR